MAKLTITSIEAVAAYDFINDNLETHAAFERCTSVDIEKSYNGTGSDKTPKIVRKFLSWCTRHAKESVANHDLEWYLVEQGKIPKTREEFLASNARLKHNIRKCAKLRFHWAHPYRHWEYSKGWIAEQLCNRYGYEAWNS